ncbi:AMP-binding protein [Beijerinckia indica]|uniref:AMP-dependent synthetase and ligase n=1 Tax=Beijerinckia indica subsp. indica (strain ATCC 9039 / DSM 1715 / NCIMB 8712) TaxID=395963 RepID=B2IIX0_BEII9|nr:AMP-binding protein [Beijerinckia indica]ACB96182.1 AMP-dependent synthetase and ligase [Beijerinckia indica subsp. indica ATCC 9039]
MRTIFDAMRSHAQSAGDVKSISDQTETLTRRDLLARVAALASDLRRLPRVIGLFAPNGVEWVIGQLACVLAGKIAVPLPTFFSDNQLAYIIRNASIELILVGQATLSRALQSGVDIHLIDNHRYEWQPADIVDGFGQVIYTSGSTGNPKGVRHESGQIAWSAAALAAATDAHESDRYLSVLPLPLLLETICAVFVPQLIGAYAYFDSRAAEAVGRSNPTELAAAFERHRPTTSVVVPQLLRSWTGELLATGGRAPASLRFVAVGGAPVPAALVTAAWDLGIPVHEGYGLSECCSVVAVNCASERRAGTVGRPLRGLKVSIEEGEIVVDGPSVMDGYLAQAAARRPWRTGDLGKLDVDGFLIVLGRKDNLIVTSFGRNISPEWIETMLLGDPRIAFCAVIGNGESYLTAILIPSAHGSAWFASASEKNVHDMIAECCANAPDYAVPSAFILVSLDQARDAQILTSNFRFVRKTLASFVTNRSLHMTDRSKNVS